MKVTRTDLIGTLQAASIGLSSSELLEQSNSFVFSKGKLTTFNDTIMYQTDSPLGDIEAAVPSADLVKVLTKFPDEEIEIDVKGTDFVIKGRKRSAGISCESEITLPYKSVPVPVKWKKIDGTTLTRMAQATRTCGNDATQYKTTCVHLTPNHIESCDNFRLFRSTNKTPFAHEILIPANDLSKIGGWDFRRVSVGENGWIHFRLADKITKVTMRCSQESWFDGIDELFKLKSFRNVSLPNNLSQIIGRAEVMNETAHDARVTVAIKGDTLILTSRKEGGWYKEKKRIKKTEENLKFVVHPRFLMEILSRTKQVMVGEKRLKIVDGDVQFVVSLEETETD